MGPLVRILENLAVLSATSVAGLMNVEASQQAWQNSANVFLATLAGIALGEKRG